MRKQITYKELLRTVHDKIPSYISFLLIMKLDCTESIFFFLLAYFLRFVGILILCGNFYMTQQDVKEHESLAYYLRFLTSYKYIEFLKLTNFNYIFISGIIFVLFCFRMFLYLAVIHKIKKRSENIRITKYQIILDHIVFLLYPFILEFLAQIYYSFCYNDIYIFKQDINKYINILFLFLNTFLIIGYNFNNYLFLNVINRPLSQRNVPVRYRYTKTKFWILFLLQNTIIIQALNFYLLTNKALKIYNLTYLCFFALLFICLFFTSLSNYNYNSVTNKFLTILSSFCFFSIISESTSRLLGYIIKTKSTLVVFNIGKIIIAVYFQYLSKNISDSFLFAVGKKEIFKVNKLRINDNSVYDVFLYMFELMKDIKYLKNGIGYILLNSIFEHQEKCNLFSCKCKLVQIVPYGKQYDINFLNNLLGRMSFLVESAFIELDYSHNYDLTILLSEHFCEFKNNPLMAYSMVQTLLNIQGKHLTMQQLLILYETAQKYIDICIKLDYNKVSDSLENVKKLQEKHYREICISFEKMICIQKMMIKYIKIEIDVIKHKGEFEDTTKIIHNEETNEITHIKIPFLNSANIEKIINRLIKENKSNKEILNELTNLKSTKLPIVFYYKCFLFCEIFWEGKIKDEIVPSLYGFTNDRNLYSNVLNQNLFILLRQRYIDTNSHLSNQKTKSPIYYSIFKYTKGMIIHYFSESLAQYLGYLQEDIINKDISVLLPEELYNAHSKIVLRHLISKQNRIFNHIHTFMFDKSRMGINSFIKGSILPGIGKHLLIITAIELKELKNTYHLYFTENFQLISMSINFKQNFLLDINLVNKYDMDLLDLFSLNENMLKNFILNEKPQMDNFKHDLSLLTEEYFVNKLFNSNNNHNKTYQLLDDLENNYSGSNDLKFRKVISNAKRKMELIHNNKMNDKIYFKTLTIKKTKNEISHNYIKFIQEKINIDYSDKSYKAIMDSYYKFKQYNNLNTENSGFNENVCEDIFEIKIYLRFLYDTPFLMLVLEEVIKSNVNKPNILLDNSNINSITTRNTLKTKNNNDETTNNKSGIMNTSTTTSIYLNKVTQYNNKREKNSCVKYVKYIIFLIVCFIFSIYIAIVIDQSMMLSDSYDIFLALFYGYEQKDNLLRLYSVILSGYFQYLSLVNYTEYVTLDYLNTFIIKKSSDYGESYHQFYQHYIKFNFDLGQDLKTLYRNYNFSKISLDWEEIIYDSNLVNEGDNIVHLSTSAVTNPNIEEIKEDLNLFFNADYKKYYNTSENKQVHSNYLIVLYFFSKNYIEIFNSIFNDLQNEIQSDYHNYSKTSKTSYVIVETLGLIVNFIFGGVIIFFLLISNNEMFRNILNLFLDYTQSENSYSLHNHLDNHILIEKLNQFNHLMENFNLDSLDKYSKIISQDSSLLLKEKKEASSLSNKMEKTIPSTKKLIEMKKEKSINKNNKNDQTSNSSKSHNKLIVSSNVGKIIAKLNQKNTNANGNTKNSLLSETFNSNNNLKKNILKEITNNTEDINDDILTIEKILEKTTCKLINKIKRNIFVLIVILLIIFLYFITKLFISLQQINKLSQLFDDFGYIIQQYSMTYFYYNNFRLLIINQKLGNETIFYSMISELQKLSADSNEVKNNRLSHYPKTFEILSILNRDDKNLTYEIYKKTLCDKNAVCKKLLDSEHNLFSDGIDIGINAFFHQIQNGFKDYSQIKNNITKIDDIKIFTDSSYQQLDLNLNYIVNLIEKRINYAFLEDVNDLKKSADKNVIIFNSSIIGFLTLMTLVSITYTVRIIMNLNKIIENSTLRLNKAFCFMKLKNMGLSLKT